MKVNAKILLLAGTLLMTAACAKQNAAEVKNSTDNSGIVGGVLVDANDPINRSTIQIFILTPQAEANATQVKAADASGGASYAVAGCSGTILSSQVILTAAHCTKKNPGQLFAYFSNQVPKDLASIFNNRDPLLRQISGGMTGANWVHLTGEEDKEWGDIALLKFPGGLPTGFGPATLIPANAAVKTNDFVTLAGYGITNGTLGTATVSLRKVDVVLTDANYSSSELLVGDESGKGACHGDSGGPAFLQVGAKQYLVGLTSRADSSKDPNGVCTAGSIYTGVQTYLGWIKAGIATLEAPDFKPSPIAEPAILD